LGVDLLNPICSRSDIEAAGLTEVEEHRPGIGRRRCSATRALPQAPGALYSESAKERVLSFPFLVRRGRTTCSRSGGAPRRAVASAQEGLPWACGCSRGMRPSSPFGSTSVESVAILVAFAAVPHERWTALGKRLHDTEHARDHIT